MAHILVPAIDILAAQIIHNYKGLYKCSFVLQVQPQMLHMIPGKHHNSCKKHHSRHVIPVGLQASHMHCSTWLTQVIICKIWHKVLGDYIKQPFCLCTKQVQYNAFGRVAVTNRHLTAPATHSSLSQPLRIIRHQPQSIYSYDNKRGTFRL